MRDILRKATPILCTLMLVGIVGCGTEEGNDPTFSSDPADAMDPTGAAPLATLTDAMMLETLKATQKEIDKARPIGIKLAIDALKASLTAKGIDASAVANINDTFIKDPTKLDKLYAVSGNSNPASDGTAELRLGLSNDKDYDCPILAKEQNAGTTCDQLATAVASQVQAQIAQDKAKVEAEIKKLYGSLTNQAQAFVAAWANAAQQYGANVALVYAQHELKAAAKCDVKLNANQISYKLGVEQGWDIVLGFRAWAIQQVTSTCTTNTDLVAETVRSRAKAKVDAYVKQTVTCKDKDISNLNDVLKAAELKREQGIKKGIDQRVEILKQELFTARQNAAACNNGGGGGEPVVIDLDGDGLQLTSQRVRFDLLGSGNRQLTTWAGPREGLLALDINENGTIDSVAELMGNKSRCGEGFCYDGLEALKSLDQNRDNVIDNDDAVFERLQVWVDRNQDGVSQAAELSSLTERGIQAIRLGATSITEVRAAGTLTERMQVVTNYGLRFAYDAWFRVALSSADLPALMP